MIEVLTAILILVTIIYAWSTLRIQKANESVVKLMGQQLELALRPYITIGYHQFPGNQMIFIRIRNTGKSAASDILFTLDQPVFQLIRSQGEIDLRDTAIFSEQIDSFAPDSELLVPIHGGATIYNSKLNANKIPLVFAITANYKWTSTSFSEKTTVDLRPFARAQRPFDPIQNELESITGGLKDLCNAVQNLRPR